MTATPASSAATPPVVDRETWLRERNELLVREKAHTAKETRSQPLVVSCR